MTRWTLMLAGLILVVLAASVLAVEDTVPVPTDDADGDCCCDGETDGCTGDCEACEAGPSAEDSCACEGHTDVVAPCGDEAVPSHHCGGCHS